MIRVEVFKRSDRIVGFTVTGHAGYADLGYDIVCAAVSALVLNAVNSCEKLLGVELKAVDDGHTLRCDVPESLDSPDVQLLLRSMVFGIEQTSGQYPDHVQLSEVHKE